MNKSSVFNTFEEQTGVSASGLKKSIGIGLIVVLSIIGFSMLGSVIESVDANEICVIQDPLDGELHWYTSAGYKGQWFGKVTKYPKRNIYRFNAIYEEADGKRVISQDHRLKIGFNDGGGGMVDGSIQYDMPLDSKNLSELHSKFGSAEAIQAQLVETVVKKSIYMTGPLMSSRESFAEKKNDLIHYVEDQIANGVYKTRRREERVKDTLTGTDKTLLVSEIVIGSNSLPERQETGQLTVFGIKPFNFSISELGYDTVVLDQIKKQQEITMAVQTSIAKAREAEQNAITVGKEGEASAAKARWEQEVVKAREVTAAEQRKAVALLDVQTADARKREQTLIGEGEGARRRAAMIADGALDKKLDAYVKVQQVYADAIKNYQGQWVPSVIMGQGGGGQQANAATSLLELMGVKAARDLGLDMNIPKNAGNSK